MRPSGPPSDRPRSSRTGSSGSERGERPQNRDRGDRPDRGERPPYRGGRPERRERPQNRDGGDRPDRGERPPYRDDRPDRGERPQNRDRGDRPDRGERPPYRGDRPNRGERPQNRDSGDRPDRGERPPYRGDRPKRGDRPPYRGDRPDRGERPPYRDDRPDRGERPQNRDRGDRPDPGERPPYRGDRPNRGERPQNRDRGDRPDRGERPPYRGDRPKRGDRPPYRGDRPDRGERPQRDGGRPRSGARYVSHALLFHVIKEKVTLDEAIDRSRAFAQLEDRDRRFVRQLVTTCLRRLGQLQLVLRDYLEEPLPPKNLNVKVLLMMGIAEHHFMRSPSHALVSEAVSLARSDEVMRNYQGLVNAVLRKVCDRDKDDLPHLRHNIPRWLAKRWYAVYGDAWLEDLSQAITQAPPTDLGVKPGADLPIISLEEAQVLADAEEERFQASRRADPKDDEIAAEVIVDPKAQDATDTALAEGENATDAASKAPSEVDETPEKAAAETPTDRPGERESQRPSTKHSTEHAQRLRAESSQSQRPRAEHIVATRLPNAALRLAPSQGSIAQLPGYEEGDWWVQDAAAQVPVMMLGDVAGKRVLDLCAAPGGKTLQLAAQGADVTAVDISENRLQRLHENLERCKLTATVVAQDALTFEDEQGFDAILLDAPCSATGTLRRHPELLWQRREDSLLTQRRLQAKLLGRAVRLLKPDGVLVYAVCSLEPEEGIEQVKAALTALPLAISAMPSTPDWLTPLLTTEGFFRSAPQTWAQYGGMDGFFAARLQRRTVEKPKAASPSQPSAGRLRLAQN